jgi:NAD(P)-dependent dehydrogenase (short-subunit alcohol dehydrogenase family)
VTNAGRRGTFEGKVVAITGAAGGVGQSLCRYFIDEGAKVAAIDRKSTVESLLSDLKASPAKFASAVADVSEPTEVERAFASLTGALGPIDILVNNAGGSTHGTLARTDAAGWRHEIKVNLDSAYFCAQGVIPSMVARRSGVIVNIGSVNGLGALGDPAYSAGKAAMISLTRSLAQEYGPYGVRANIVLPGTIRTPVWEKRAAKDPKVLETLRRWYPLGRIVEPVDIARAVGFLASDAASAITGVALPVDCGLMSGNIVMRQELTLEDL